MKMREFFLPILKPYWLCILLMFQAPIVDCMYYFTSNYAIKMLVDLFSDPSLVLTFNLVLLPVLLYIGSVVTMETSWRISQYNWMKSQPSIRAEVISKAYNYVQGHSYGYFQNIQSGQVVSKIKGIVDGYNNMWFAVHHRVTCCLLKVLICFISFGFIRLELLYFVITWCCVFIPVVYLTSSKIYKLSNQTSESKHKAIAMVADNITNIFTIFAFSAKGRESAKLNKHLTQDMEFKDRLQIKYEILQTVIGSILYCVMLFSLFLFMVKLRIDGKISTGDFVFTMSFAWFFVEQIWNLFFNITEFIRNLGDFKSSFSILQAKQDVIDKVDAKQLVI